MSYNFNSIPQVLTADELVNVVLSYTQRKTPTEVHTSFQISRIRGFYMRKVKTTQQVFHKKLSDILDRFPRLDDIHPFFADLMNVLYDKDHYKLALGQINMARHLIDNIARDYIKMMKYADSLYRCKQLKRAALGRMCTLIKKIKHSFAYLEYVRQHLSRLPNINPTTKTLIISGYPNVGKTSLVNQLTNTKLDVQPYAFTTKSLLLGHMDFKYSTWQVMDTPGILDHALEERNTIEMQSVTALAHLQAAIVFVIDMSEACGYPVEQQVRLFHNLKPLFIGKPLILMLNKVDKITFDELDDERKTLILNEVREVEKNPTLMFVRRTLADVEAQEKENEESSRELRGTMTMDEASAATTTQPGAALTLEEAEKNNSLNVPCVLHHGIFIDVVETSTLKCTGLAVVKEFACERLLKLREQVKSRTSKTAAAATSLMITFPQHVEPGRGPIIPDSVLQMKKERQQALAEELARKAARGGEDDEDEDEFGEKEMDFGGMDIDMEEKKPKRELERDRALREQGAYVPKTRELYILADPEWKFDTIPEIMDGKNIADFVDPDIERKLKELEEEEEQLLKQERAARKERRAAGLQTDDDYRIEVHHDHHRPIVDKEEESEFTRLKMIAGAKKEKVRERERKMQERKKKLKEERKRRKQMGEDQDEDDDMSPELKKKKKKMDEDDEDDEEEDEDDDEDSDISESDEFDLKHYDSDSSEELEGKRKRGRFAEEKKGSQSRARSRSKSVLRANMEKRAASLRAPSVGRPAPRDAHSIRLVTDSIVKGEGFSSLEQRERARKKMKKAQKMEFGYRGKRGESDKHVDNRMPKHLFTGKFSIGKRDRR
ncbi:putative Nucleolar GTP-binding protein 1 (NOG1) [Monocercomonoides exilis]|uniref:putative Nucleolar GTP-binding protein 1 (NOG1) n=1 Tax=Monocercomonoides exilis TaxID=2049356 RepID=UPI00355A1DBB|nr:putative Nucleolar GTP-binding protein 1 (NOG1) [Monocercomonoides exilis]|eukprot:MONOS_4700.1-p1 / transcript=MONOS_4700.1 / gene=MONOS_4700 / organism=Monocercomonoides_exilis_PA203 / gene_product=Nucleolar GTP-binding protein 1 (NOG1) / transcript_product=Nucleolar GTP-binding protein 1 (NOG1) / location=Mono_scaffold00128:16210-19134(-) / protein_length=835 / sequence_SO=supercontig / SO=protein_coding / is_pseudo=false